MSLKSLLGLNIRVMNNLMLLEGQWTYRKGLSLSSSFKHSRPSELQYAYRHEIDLNQANKILSN